MNWRELEATVDTAVASAFAEPVRLSFFTGGQVDPDRPAVDIVAILIVGPDEPRPVGTGFVSSIAAGDAHLFIDRSTYAGPAARAKDKVRATSRVGQPWFEVASVSDRDSNMIVLALTGA